MYRKKKLSKSLQWILTQNSLIIQIGKKEYIRGPLGLIPCLPSYYYTRDGKVWQGSECCFALDTEGNLTFPDKNARPAKEFMQFLSQRLVSKIQIKDNAIFADGHLVAFYDPQTQAILKSSTLEKVDYIFYHNSWCILSKAFCLSCI